MRAKSWVKELQRQASPNIVIALAGNKSDLADKRLVEIEVCSITRAHNFCSVLTIFMFYIFFFCTVLDVSSWSRDCTFCSICL